MRILADENLPYELILSLRKSGHDISETPFGLPDNEIIQLAKRQKRILLTQDKHFANLLIIPSKILWDNPS